jgi:RsiW-degrading membrane proteinase PrsW (M82 family)
MIKPNAAIATLKQLPPPGVGGGPTTYPLSATQSTVIGRDASCLIVLDPKVYRGVSRRHAEIRPLATAAPNGLPVWQVFDLGSANGTYINGKRLSGCHTLQNGDRIRLDVNGPEFVFELQANAPATPRPKPLSIPDSASLHLSQILPIASTGKDLFKKAYLLPGIVTVVLVVFLFFAPNPIQEPICRQAIFNPLGFQTNCYNVVLGTYLCLGSLFFTYLLCGKPKPWWVLLGSALVPVVILSTPLKSIFFFVFREIPPNVQEILAVWRKQSVSFPQLFYSMWFAAGLMEELLKAVPILAALYMGPRLQLPWREKIGVWEPLDGILLGAASGVGFTFIETLGEYVPGQLINGCQTVSGNESCSEAGLLLGAFMGLKLLLPRILGNVAGHMAYSGYFGYFIGLSVLKPSKRWQLLGIGYLTSSTVHALWNSSSALTSGSLEMTILLQSTIGGLSYAFLVAAILKARQLSPSRAQNFATRMLSSRHIP